jgi:hypothetical protein
MVDLPHLRQDERPRQRALLRVRRVAALRQLAAVLLVAGFLAAPVGALAAEPSAPPVPRPPTCAERFPEEGPAGVDLRLGCIVSEIVGVYAPGQASAPPTISTYAIVLLGIALGVAALAGLATRLLARRAGRALAPVTPDAWWQCPRCRSVNAAGAGRCYSCGAARPEDVGAMLMTDDDPGTPQSFGRGKRG